MYSNTEHLKISIGRENSTERKIYEIFSLSILKQVLTYFQTSIRFRVNKFLTRA